MHASSTARTCAVLLLFYHLSSFIFIVFPVLLNTNKRNINNKQQKTTEQQQKSTKQQQKQQTVKFKTTAYTKVRRSGFDNVCRPKLTKQHHGGTGGGGGGAKDHTTATIDTCIHHPTSRPPVQPLALATQRSVSGHADQRMSSVPMSSGLTRHLSTVSPCSHSHTKKRTHQNRHGNSPCPPPLKK